MQYLAGDEITRTPSGAGIGLVLVVQLAESMGAAVGLINAKLGTEL
ncbi:MAG: hypothetical protein KAJ63_11060 [Methyloprofundus sp.]|nr:hypothetical protein [Methyloprofundus sp.]